MLGISYQVHGLAEVRAKLRPELVTGPAKGLVHAAARFAVREAAADAPKDTGSTARSIGAVVHELSARIQSSSAAALPIDVGRHPGRVMPPTSALRGWAQRHGLAGLEFVIARSIARRGIKGRFFMHRAMQKLHEHELPRLIGVAKNAIEADWLGR